MARQSRRIALNSDIRLQMGFYSNTKVKKLHRMLGADAVLSLIYLWLYTAENRPHGELRGMDETDIEIAAQWNGEHGKFISAICSEGTKFLDKKGKLFVVHDWQENNPYAYHAPLRKQQAKKAAEAKWAKYNKNNICSEQESAVLTAMLNNEMSNAPSPYPSPSPVPSPKEKETKNTYAEFVSMTEAQYQKLLSDHGEEKTAWMINKLNSHKGSSGQKYKSDYHAILSWVVEAYAKAHTTLGIVRRGRDADFEKRFLSGD